uniref:Uncharacterized protein n=1 Tax=Thermogemmatispora argillosa TaxID=2045280 RepID=A0A455T7Q2_9CHLR|nr:hypothetical protein KTA_36740 [Thermogemmatispora argillosa]
MRGVSEVTDCGHRCQVVLRTLYRLFVPSLLTTLAQPLLCNGSCCLRGYTTCRSLSTPESLFAPLGRSIASQRGGLEATPGSFFLSALRDIEALPQEGNKGGETALTLLAARKGRGWSRLTECAQGWEAFRGQVLYS